MRKKIIMVYPRQGFSEAFVKHAPIGLLYASSEVIKADYDVKIFDCRIYPNSWEKRLSSLIDKDTLAVGISVMSGKPIVNASQISQLVKKIDPEVKVVWGGPHATFQPDSILAFEPNCDYVVSGYASWAFKCLIDCISKNNLPKNVAGISYRNEEGEVIKVPKDEVWENIPYQEIPYHLIPDYKVYSHIGEKKTIFSMYSVLGCPYQCSFCSSPAQYRSIPGKKWVPLTVLDVVNHIEYVVEKFGANFIYFIDDDSFVRLDHVEGIIDEIKKRHLDVKLGFRGARINEIKKMTDSFLVKLSEAGTNIMHVGAESGSNRILKLIRKDCTVDDVIECNRKLARHPEIMVGYNFIIGLPTETIEELKKTRDLMFQLVKDHPRCIIFLPNKFRPLPETELFEIAVRDWGYTAPKSLKDWANIEAEGDYTAPWITREMKSFCDLMQVGSYFVDNKALKVAQGDSLIEKSLRVLDRLYGPVARFRLKHGICRGLIEYHMYDWVQRLSRHIGSFVGSSAEDKNDSELLVTNC